MIKCVLHHLSQFNIWLNLSSFIKDIINNNKKIIYYSNNVIVQKILQIIFKPKGKDGQNLLLMLCCVIRIFCIVITLKNSIIYAQTHLLFLQIYYVFLLKYFLVAISFDNFNGVWIFLISFGFWQMYVVLLA